MSVVPLAQRIAGAPISWGVCEAPGWGHEIGPDRVLAEMRTLGLESTELGPTGYLGPDPASVRSALSRFDMTLIGGFLPVVLHRDPAEDYAHADEAMATLAAAGATVVVLAAQSVDGSYDRLVPVDDRGWEILLANLDRVLALSAQHGLRASVHPHVGTAIESRASVRRLIETSDVALCLDTGHLVLGGMAPLELLELAVDRVSHVHLKDVRLDVAAAMSGGDRDYVGAVRRGLYAPLGSGDLDIAGIVGALENVGYQGWYVLEQDCALTGEPPGGQGPVLDAARSVGFLRDLAGRHPSGAPH